MLSLRAHGLGEPEYDIRIIRVPGRYIPQMDDEAKSVAVVPALSLEYPTDPAGIPIKNPACKNKSPPAFKSPPREVALRDAAIARGKAALAKQEVPPAMIQTPATQAQHQVDQARIAAAAKAQVEAQQGIEIHTVRRARLQ